jgi:C-terminal processing protease CtpA/Prc
VGSARYKELIDPFPEPESFFNFLKHEDDKYSLIRSNYEVLENSIRGIDASNGVKFLLTRYGGGDSVMGIVTYILEGSDADEKDINRGDIFTGVDGQNLTVSNYSGLLFGENLDYTLNMADLNNNLLSPNGKNIALTKTENFQSNPIQLSKIIELGGTKVGYIMYNQFTEGFDDDLNEVFGNFKASGISELVLDLRYNGGGLVSSAVHLSGMISGQFNGEKFASFIYNQKVMNYYNSIEELKSRLNINFTNQLSDGSPINSLNLNKVYIITSERSASASELVINGLSPLMDVVQVGDNTYGKNVGGPAAVYDYIDNNGTKNPDHTYAMYPITFYIANGEDFYEYADGLSPKEDLKLKEDISNLGVLGENSDPLLALALNHISSISTRYKFQIPVFPLENTLQDPKFIQQLLIPSIKELPPIQFD